MTNKVTILWVNDNPITADTMVFMYAINAKKQEWFQEVEIIIWGPTATLVATDAMIQDKIKQAQEAGVIVKACISCANKLGVTQQLKDLNLQVYGMGLELTNILKNKEHLLTI